MQLISKIFNLKGELFASTFSYGATAVIRLGSSLVLTRLLNPEAYGIVGILMSIAFMVELLSDVGTTGLLIRHVRGGERTFVHTVWTVRFIRACVNAAALYLLAPVIASIYDMPVLIDALRIFSLWFVLQGLESMSFVLAQRDQRARIGNYAELFTNAVMTVAVIAMATVFRDHYALLYGLVLQRLLMTVISHFLYRNVSVGVAFDKEAVKDQFQFARFVLPSSILSIVLSQYDRVILLKLFDLAVLGVYGLAGSMIGPVMGLVNHNCRAVLYPRCSEYFRSDRLTAVKRYYQENARLLWTITLPPAILAGFSQALITILYDSRYARAGIILMVMGLGGTVASLQASSENLLVASGRTRVVLIANIIRVCTIAPATLLGNYLFGLLGFIWFGFAVTFIPLGYFYIEQRRWSLLNVRSELTRIGWAILAFVISLALGGLLLRVIPSDIRHHAFH